MFNSFEWNSNAICKRKSEFVCFSSEFWTFFGPTKSFKQSLQISPQFCRRSDTSINSVKNDHINGRWRNQTIVERSYHLEVSLTVFDLHALLLVPSLRFYFFYRVLCVQILQHTNRSKHTHTHFQWDTQCEENFNGLLVFGPLFKVA